MSSPLVAPGKPYTNTPQETSMVVWWQASTAPGLTGYRVEVRQFPQPWDTAKVDARSPSCLVSQFHVLMVACGRGLASCCLSNLFVACHLCTHAGS